MRGDEETARAKFLTARTEVEKELQNQPNYAEAICALGVIDALLGNKESAIKEGERAVELMPVTKNAVQGPLLIKYLAAIYAWVGEKDRALERLNEAVHLPSYLSYGQVRLHPLWEPLRGDARFEQIVNTLAPKP